MSDRDTNDSESRNAAPGLARAHLDARKPGLLGERHADALSIQELPPSSDRHEPRTGYRPELDERVPRYGEYGMVIGVPHSQPAPAPPVSNPVDHHEPQLPDEQARLRDLQNKARGTEQDQKFTEDLNELRTHRASGTTTGQTQTVVQIDGTPI